MSWEEFKKRMEAEGITEYSRIVPRLKKAPEYCHRCGEEFYGRHECEEELK